jgi:hypothetical protein
MMAEMPEPPDGLTAAGLGLWLGSVALNALRARQLDTETTCKVLTTVLTLALAHAEPSNEKLIREFTLQLERTRAGRADN